MLFYLGTHETSWLKSVPDGVPLFVSARRLRSRKSLPVAAADWALDSGGFTELSMYGRWVVTPQQYVAEVRRWSAAIGLMKWTPCQDWMCEAPIVTATGIVEGEFGAEWLERYLAVRPNRRLAWLASGNGPELTEEVRAARVRLHQRRTTLSYITLKSLAPEIHWVPVLQGYTFEEYMNHYDEYHRALPFPLSGHRLVGLGSICRRQGTGIVEDLARELHARGVRIHAFGLKLQGLRRCARYLASADSMAWSYDARLASALPGCTHKNCANCMRYALKWRRKALSAAGVCRQDVLF